ncbi:MAG: redox-regulated ATPase YchF [Minisyncoccia bacterium]
MSIGIVGLPNVGKSTLFKLLTKQNINIANYPFATIDPNVGVVTVPDERVGKLVKLSNSKKTVPAVVEFYDIAGLVKDAHQGEGLGNQFLANIRNVQAILHLVRCFGQSDIIHVEGGVDPIRDIDIIEMELVFKDLETVTKRLPKLEAEVRGGDKNAAKNFPILQEVKKKLENGNLALEFKDEQIVKELQLLTAKPQLFLLNGKPEEASEELKKKIGGMGFDFIISDLGTTAFVPELILKAYKILNLMSFFTTGEDETRAWTIERGSKAPQAAGVIHTDFENKFIRAEAISCDKLLEAGGWNQAKQKGWLRLEGKDYVVQEGDVMVIRHG